MSITIRLYYYLQYLSFFISLLSPAASSFYLYIYKYPTTINRFLFYHLLFFACWVVLLSSSLFFFLVGGQNDGSPFSHTPAYRPRQQIHLTVGAIAKGSPLDGLSTPSRSSRCLHLYRRLLVSLGFFGRTFWWSLSFCAEFWARQAKRSYKQARKQCAVILNGPLPQNIQSWRILYDTIALVQRLRFPIVSLSNKIMHFIYGRNPSNLRLLRPGPTGEIYVWLLFALYDTHRTPNVRSTIQYSD